MRITPIRIKTLIPFKLKVVGFLKELPKILIVGTGGIISGKTFGKYRRSGEYLQEEILELVPEVKKYVKMQVSNLFRVDSADMQPEHWMSLAQFIYYYLQEVDGVVVTHGTDTMHYTAAAMAFMIRNLNVPIVFTGSEATPGQIGSDSKRNVVDAIRVAINANLAESVIVFDDKIIRGVRAKKVRANDFDAFESIAQPKLGSIQKDIVLEMPHKRRKKAKPKLSNNLESAVRIVRIHPGIDSATIEKCVDVGIKGFVFEGYGLGNIPLGKSSLRSAIENATKSGVPIVMTSECELGIGWQETIKSEVMERLKNLDIIAGYDMTTECALVKLMWVLGQTRKMSRIKKMMLTNYHGEIETRIEPVKRVWEQRI